MSARYLSQSEHDSLVDVCDETKKHEPIPDNEDLFDKIKRETPSRLNEVARFLFCKPRKTKYRKPYEFSDQEEHHVKKVCLDLNKLQNRRLISYYLSNYDPNHMEEAVQDLHESEEEIKPPVRKITPDLVNFFSEDPIPSTPNLQDKYVTNAK